MRAESGIRGIEFLLGWNSVREALVAGRRRVHRVLFAEGLEERERVEQVERLCLERKLPTQRVRRTELDKLSGELRHQGVAAQVSPYPYAELPDLLALAQSRGEAPFLLLLDSLEDPQNVGSLLRTAEAVGVHGVVLPERRAAGVTPAVSRASAGAVEHLLVANVTNLVRAMEELKEAGVWVVAVEDRPDAQDYRTLDLNMPLALVLGSEGKGVRRLVLEKSDLVARIPMRGRLDSLNVAVAGSLLLYAAWNARSSGA